MKKLRFSGHDTFTVRTFWPKKGYDFIVSGGRFNDEGAVVKLGVGKNMVSSINHWMKSLDLFDGNKGQVSELAHFLFAENGVDLFLEDIGSIWLLHYHLVTNNYASIFNLVFNKLRKERSGFTKKQVHSFIKRQFHENEVNGYNHSTIDKDTSVFLRTYNTPDYKTIKKDFEDEVGGLFTELELMSSKRDFDLDGGKVDWYELDGKVRQTLPAAILFHTILDCFPKAENISFRRLEIEENSPGMVFALSKEGLYIKLKEIEQENDGVFVTESAGNTTLVLRNELDKWEVLRNYYGN